MNQLATMEPRTAQQIYPRLTAMEKIDIRRASPDRLAFLAYTSFAPETGSNVAVMEELQKMCNQEIVDYDNTPNIRHIPSTWKF